MNKTHGMSDTSTYRSWEQMIQRCTDRGCKDWRWYGARGIKVCRRWRKFENFLEDMGFRPEGKTLDRQDSNGNYTKHNCRWADKFQQKHNRTDNVQVTFAGRTQPLAVWARECGIHFETLRHRLKRGWDAHRALTTPVVRNANGATYA